MDPSRQLLSCPSGMGPRALWTLSNPPPFHSSGGPGSSETGQTWPHCCFSEISFLSSVQNIQCAACSGNPVGPESELTSVLCLEQPLTLPWPCMTAVGGRGGHGGQLECHMWQKPLLSSEGNRTAGRF